MRPEGQSVVALSGLHYKQDASIDAVIIKYFQQGEHSEAVRRKALMFIFCMMPLLQSLTCAGVDRKLLYSTYLLLFYLRKCHSQFCPITAMVVSHQVLILLQSPVL